MTTGKASKRKLASTFQESYNNNEKIEPIPRIMKILERSHTICTYFDASFTGENYLGYNCDRK